MLEAFLIGLIANGVYHLALVHRKHLEQKQGAKILSKEEIRNSLKTGLKSLFSNLSKDIPEINCIDEGQIKNLQDLFFRSDGELTDILRQTIIQSIDGVSSYKLAGVAPPVDMFSVQGFEHILAEFTKVNSARICSLTLRKADPSMLKQINPFSAHLFAKVIKFNRGCATQNVF